MDIEQLYLDYSVDYRTEGHKHCRPGWINVECPFCTGNPGYHLGYNLQSNFYVCWRCGVHQVDWTIAKLLKLPINDAKELVSQYGLIIPGIRTVKVEKEKVDHKFPTGVVPLQANHKKYLIGRNFDPDKLEEEYGLLGTGPISLLDHIDYKHRIMIPFIWNGEQVSFDSRDITEKHTSKYMACPKNREKIEHKNILYGRQHLWMETGICVEGPSDVWRFGANAFATSGIKYTPQQVRLMARLFKKIWICFDANEPQALQQMYNLRGDLRFRGVDAKLALLDRGDPGSMSQKAADKFVNSLMKY